MQKARHQRRMEEQQQRLSDSVLDAFKDVDLSLSHTQSQPPKQTALLAPTKPIAGALWKEDLLIRTDTELAGQNHRKPQTVPHPPPNSTVSTASSGVGALGKALGNKILNRLSMRGIRRSNSHKAIKIGPDEQDPEHDWFTPPASTVPSGSLNHSHNNTTRGVLRKDTRYTAGSTSSSSRPKIRGGASVQELLTTQRSDEPYY
eukprot:CAMPEP_0171326120 /NCGR_PEP_ID=MMETSP0816-20121228/117244_1 /TAXON_ID=420281 /ORGANISM="Proboscia inermis, Strain CCAP1064/1" /LENGTH=202 /DNA_ID=CAMNT_0011825485 /DNA_START=1041 /DNA_END=1649 /DNA_ORIENTATION=-